MSIENETITLFFSGFTSFFLPDFEPGNHCSEVIPSCPDDLNDMDENEKEKTHHKNVMKKSGRGVSSKYFRQETQLDWLKYGKSGKN